MVLGNMLWSLWRGKPAPGNPWGAATLEWTHTTSPPDHHNFHRTPLVTHGPYDYEVLFSGDGAGGDGAGRVRVAGDPAPVPDPMQGAPQEMEKTVDMGTSQPKPKHD
jgi:cytochrome c oxidase subunit 1